MSYLSIPVRTSLFLQLARFLEEKGTTRDPVSTVEMAIEYWMDNADWKSDDLLPETRPAQKLARGYRWKELFLPDKTEVRMRYKGKYHYAKVVGDDFLYDDRIASPSQFANNVTGTSRNAWRDLEVKRPTDLSWRLAEQLR